MRLLDGLPVVNATEPLLLDISRNDIARANRQEPQQCAVARACRRYLAAKEVRVHLGRIYIRTSDDNWVRYLTPEYLRLEIIAFDRGGEFMRGKYQLSPPSPAKRAGKRQGTKSNRKTGAKRAPGRQIANVRIASPLAPRAAA